jgi:hypothetical protein
MSTPDGLPSISGHRYEGYPLEQKYGWMQLGQGSDAVSGGTDLLRALARRYADSERAIRTELGRLGVTWEGTAAEAVAAELGRVADRAEGGAATSAAGGSGISAYGDSFAQLRSKIPAPVEAGETSLWGNAADSLGGGRNDDLSAVTGLQSDYRGRLAEYRRLDRAANDALYAHEANSRRALDTFPIPDNPPVVTTLAAATGTPSTDAGLGKHPGLGQHPDSGRAGDHDGDEDGTSATGGAGAGAGPGGAGPGGAGAGSGPGGAGAGGRPVPAHDPDPSDQSPTTALGAGGVARAGRAVPGSGLPGGGAVGPLGVDPGGVSAGPGGDYGVAGFGGRGYGWTRYGYGGDYGGDYGGGSAGRYGGGSGDGYGGDYGGGLRSLGIPGFSPPVGEPTSEPGAGRPGFGSPGAERSGCGGSPRDVSGAGYDGRPGSGAGGYRGQGGHPVVSPSDQPFAVPYDDVPAVLGLPADNGGPLSGQVTENRGRYHPADRQCDDPAVDYRSDDPAAHYHSAVYDGGIYDGGIYDGGIYDGGIHDGGIHDGEIHDGEIHRPDSYPADRERW